MLISAWSLADSIRFLYYAFPAADKQPPRFVTWLRYSAFIVLYPAGFSHEMYSIWQARHVIFGAELDMDHVIEMQSGLRAIYVVTLALVLPGTERDVRLRDRVRDAVHAHAGSAGEGPGKIYVHEGEDRMSEQRFHRHISSQGFVCVPCCAQSWSMSTAQMRF